MLHAHGGSCADAETISAELRVRQRWGGVSFRLSTKGDIFNSLEAMKQLQDDEEDSGLSFCGLIRTASAMQEKMQLLLKNNKAEMSPGYIGGGVVARDHLTFMRQPLSIVRAFNETPNLCKKIEKIHYDETGRDIRPAS